MADSKVVIGYWGFHGRAQISRYLCEYLGISYEDKIYSDYNEWFGKDSPNMVKSGFNFPNLPYLLDGDYKLTESKAIEQYLIKRSGKKDQLLGKTLREESNILMLCGAISDYVDVIVKLCTNMQGYDTERPKFYTESGKAFFELITNALGNKKFLTGDEVTYADFCLYEGMCYYRGIFPEEFKQFDKLVGFMVNFEKIPKIQEYQSSNRYCKMFLAPTFSKWTGI